jgi:hypothetical protein
LFASEDRQLAAAAPHSTVTGYSRLACDGAVASAEGRVVQNTIARARTYDRELRRLAHAEVHHRCTFGLLAHDLLKRKAYHDLGFARLGDYSRERLDCSARELQSMASVAMALHTLPQLASALARGEISWTHARVLVTMATPPTEHVWLASARGRTVREIEKLVSAARGAASTGDPADTSNASTGGHDHPARAVERDESTVRFHLPVPRRLRARWRHAVELARRMSGEPLPPWQAAEAITAECLSGVLVGLMQPDQLEACAVGHSGAGAGSAVPDVVAAPNDIPERSAPESIGCPADMLDVQLRTEVHAMQTLDATIGRQLRRFIDAGGHRALGYPSVGDYVETRLGICSRRARALLALERGARRAPAVYEAYRAGRLSWLRALTIVPIARGAHATAWVARAREVTIRRLVDEVQWACDACDTSEVRVASMPPPARGAWLWSRERQMRARSDNEPDESNELHQPADGYVAFYGPAAVVATLHSAIAVLTPAGRPRWRGLSTLLEHAIAEWEAQPRHHDPIFARDGWRCAVPACSSRRNLHDHHVRFRSRGGDNAHENRVTVCAWHHLRGIHGGRVRAFGRAPNAIRWELGRRHNGEPALTLEGDYYVTAM